MQVMQPRTVMAGRSTRRFKNHSIILKNSQWKNRKKQGRVLKNILDIYITVLYDTHNLNNDSFSLIQSGGGT